jgi:hypothetical protein
MERYYRNSTFCILVAAGLLAGGSYGWVPFDTKIFWSVHHRRAGRWPAADAKRGAVTHGAQETTSGSLSIHARRYVVETGRTLCCATRFPRERGSNHARIRRTNRQLRTVAPAVEPGSEERFPHEQLIAREQRGNGDHQDQRVLHLPAERPLRHPNL